jgi:hypothetical protein|nr:MAG TPA: hypothetical protein [Caudoviricetes sp.]
MSLKTNNELASGKDGLEKVLQITMKCLVEGALSIKLTQEATIAMNERFKEKPTDEEYHNTPTLFTLPNGVLTASVNYIVDEWLEPEVLNFVEKQGEFKPYAIIKHFISEIDKIKVEVI